MPFDFEVTLVLHDHAAWPLDGSRAGINAMENMLLL